MVKQDKPDKFAGKFEFLEHTADTYIRALGTTMQEAYENAALALFETMTDSGKIAQTVEETVDVEAEDQYATCRFHTLREMPKQTGYRFCPNASR